MRCGSQLSDGRTSNPSRAPTLQLLAILVPVPRERTERRHTQQVAAFQKSWPDIAILPTDDSVAPEENGVETNRSERKC